MDPVDLYDRNGNKVTISMKVEEVRLRAAGYRDTPPFNPADHNVDEVTEHLTEHPEDAPRVLTAERRGKRRSTLVGDTDDSAGGDPAVSE